MRRLPIVLALIAAISMLLACGNAFGASTSASSVDQPSLDHFASAIAGQPIEVRCWLNEQDQDADPDAWGYVWLYSPVIYMDPLSCAGALALQSGAMVPLWQLGLGALVLTHEAYHLKLALPDWRRGSEAQTECRAIKRVPQSLSDLGANPELADSVLPWALAIHWRIAALDDAYDWPGCRVPVFADFWPS